MVMNHDEHSLRRILSHYIVQLFDERYEISLRCIYVHVMKDRLKALGRLEHAHGDAKGFYYRLIVDHLIELEQKETAERPHGYSAMIASRELLPPRLWPVSHQID